MDEIASRLAGATMFATALAASPAILARHRYQEMSRMQDDMGRSEMTPEARKRMATRMRQMSEMMRRMSGWADRPNMREPEMRRQFDGMRTQMDRMSRSNSMGT